MTSPRLTVRQTTAEDMGRVSSILAAGYGKLMVRDYSADLLARVVPLISRPPPELLTSTRYFIVELGDAPAASGGWSHEAPGSGTVTSGLGHIRFVAAHPAQTRRGAARAVMEAIFDQARGQGIERFDCLSTRTAVPFYTRLGFVTSGEDTIDLPGGAQLPVIRMHCSL
jgi:GNAT superfamily N-acetyltransferase